MIVQGATQQLIREEYSEDNAHKLLEKIVSHIEDRFTVLMKLEKYTKERYVQPLKKYMKHLLFEIDEERKRIEAENQMITQLMQEPKLTRKLKSWFTEFSFVALYKLQPSLDTKLEKHYVNLIKLYQCFFQYIKKQQYFKKILEIKQSNQLFKIEVYISLINVLLQYIRTTFSTKLCSVRQALSFLLSKQPKQKNQQPRLKLFHKQNSQFQIFQSQTLNTLKSPENTYQRQNPGFVSRLPNIRNHIVTEKLQDRQQIIKLKAEYGFQSKVINLEERKNDNQHKIITIKRFKKQQDAYFQQRTSLSKQETEMTQDKYLPRLTLKPKVCKSPSLKTYYEGTLERKATYSKSILPAESQFKDFNVQYIKLDKIIRYAGYYYQYLDLFYPNLNLLYKLTQIEDLEYDHILLRQKKQKDRREKKPKFQWVQDNILKLIQYRVNKNNEISKIRDSYTTNYFAYKNRLGEKFEE